MLTDREIENIIRTYEMDAIGYSGLDSAIQQKRAVFQNFYNQRKYGDEVEGQSQYVSSDVYEVIEGMLPPLMRFFTQGKNVAEFESTKVGEEYDIMAEQKTAYCNHVFKANGGVRILYDMLKDGLMQYTGFVKVTQEEQTEKTSESYRGLSEMEVEVLREKPDFELVEVVEDNSTFSVRGEYSKKVKMQKVQVIPPNETLILRSDRDFIKPRFIGQNTPKSRSELIKMGFDKKTVMELGQDDTHTDVVNEARFYDHGSTGGTTSYQSQGGSIDKSQDQLRLGEYYTYIDVDGDGVSELWQVFYCENKLLSKTRVDKHPYFVFTPTPVPHRAIGTCPAEHVAPIQHWRSTLIRQMNNNVYHTNFNRVIVKDNGSVNLDDVINLSHGGVVRTSGDEPVQNAVMPFPVMNQVPAVLSAIQYSDEQREKNSGITAYNQGMDTESLNKTATGFTGIRDMSMMRIEIIARHAADTVRRIFERIAENAMRYQDEKLQIKVTGQAMEIDPTLWRDGAECTVGVGIGGGDRQERIQNLNFILMQQKEFLQMGIPLSDPQKIYKTLDKLCLETGLIDAQPYFVDPAVPQDQLMAENFQLKQQLQQMQAEQENPLAEAERAKGEMRLMEQRQKQEHDMNMKMAEMEQKDVHHKDDVMLDLTKMELDSQKDVPGSAV